MKYVVDFLICYPDRTWEIKTRHVDVDTDEFSVDSDIFREELIYLSGIDVRGAAVVFPLSWERKGRDNR